jgi:hypothetical protein
MRLLQQEQGNLGGTAMFENATHMIQKHLPAGNHPSWVAPLIALFVAWTIFMVIREFWCWFWKTSKIASELERINSKMDALQRIGAECGEELSRTKSTLQRIAERVPANAGNKQGESESS